MSAYLVTREGQKLGTFKTSKIEKGLKTGFFRVSDLGWREASGWQGLSEIVGTAKAIDSASNAPLMEHAGSAARMAAVQAGAGSMVPPALIEELTNTRPWVRFISIVMGIGCALMILACLIGAANGASSLAEKTPPPLRGETQNLIIAAICVLLTFLILYPAVKLNNYASNIARLAKSQSLTDLAAALTEQRRFWKFYGILMVITTALFFLLMMAGMGMRSLMS